MNGFRKKFLSAICLIFTLTLSAGAAHAKATAMNSAKIFLNNRTNFYTTDNGMSLNLYDQGNSSWAKTVHDGTIQGEQYMENYGWCDTLAWDSYWIPKGSTTVTADTSTNHLLSSVSLSSDKGGIFEGYASADRWGSFSVTGSGNVSLFVNYTISPTLFETMSRPWELATAFSSAGFSLENKTSGDKTDTGWDGTIWSPSGNAPLNDNISQSGTMMVNLHFNDGDTGYFRAHVASSAQVNSVPEPATCLLLGLGLTGLVGLRKKT